MPLEQDQPDASNAASQFSSARIDADLPVNAPEQDEFQYNAFAKTLAKATVTTPSPKGVVMSLHGPWGSGKSSLLNLVKHHLNTIPEDQGRPLVIEFNPWWFNGREQLAGQLLTQFHKALFNESELLRAAGDLLAQYAGTISKAVTISSGIPALDWVAKPFLKLLGRKPVDVPKMKEKLSDALGKAGKRILIIIDDIDRLTPPEMMEVFKVVKALGDFPNVLYLLSFDRDVVAEAIGKQINANGATYLEKIIQASFSLPVVSQAQLDQKLLTEIGILLSELPTSANETHYFHSAYLDGLQQYIEKPRDVVRIRNVLSVTYPPVAGEVNWADFIALEFMRVFEPLVYETIRDQAHMFMGEASFSGRTEARRTFHEGWLENVPVEKRNGIRELVCRLFPRVKVALKNHLDQYSGNQLYQQMRVCCPDFRSIYFSFGVPDIVLGRAEGDRFIEKAADPEAFASDWNEARNIIRPDGHSKARDILDHFSRLPGSAEPAVAKRILKALLAVPGDLLIDEDQREYANSWAINFALLNLLRQIPDDERIETLRDALSSANAISACIFLVHSLIKQNDNPEPEQLNGVDDVVLEEFKALMVLRVKRLELETLLAYQSQAFMLGTFAKWASVDEARARYLPVLADDHLLAAFMEKLASKGSMWASNDRVGQMSVHINQNAFDPIASPAEIRPRIQALLAGVKHSAFQRAVAKEYLRVTENPSSDETQTHQDLQATE
ncbi:P-loop NTPase fold protein [Pseudomonas sp. BN417]|uniref:KAP family P-loop NTPase fold protein n=1 Tax=Pseudomonas sp. BN417 TaxID=2567890 RepID=UPI0024582D92|nr:P-loop NTPase fold protein [Pseudomonas sp. BN417]